MSDPDQTLPGIPVITLEALEAIVPHASPGRLATFVTPLNQTIAEFGISKVAEFLAQTAHESEGFLYLREIWGPTPAQAKYEGRADLGNNQPGDGVRFKGRGLIQITGRANYTACGIALNLPLLDEPELLEHPDDACRSAGWFWKEHSLDAVDDFETLTRRINGGLNGLADRYAYLGRAKNALEG